MLPLLVYVRDVKRGRSQVIVKYRKLYPHDCDDNLWPIHYVDGNRWNKLPCLIHVSWYISQLRLNIVPTHFFPRLAKNFVPTFSQMYKHRQLAAPL